MIERRLEVGVASKFIQQDKGYSFTTIWANSADDKSEIVSFSQKQGFKSSCKLTSFLFLVKIRKNITVCRLLKSAKL